jgi:hypothetical protein
VAILLAVLGPFVTKEDGHIYHAADRVVTGIQMQEKDEPT